MELHFRVHAVRRMRWRKFTPADVDYCMVHYERDTLDEKGNHRFDGTLPDGRRGHLRGKVLGVAP